MKSQHKSSSPYPQWNNEKFEAKLAKEIEQRRNLISTSTNYILQNEEQNSMYQINETNEDMPLHPTGVYKQFLLIGVPPSIEDSHDPNVKPSVLIAYPPFEYPNMEIKKIIPHCMPTGHTRKFLSYNTLSPIQDEFVFQFSGTEGKPIYGICVHVSTKDTSLPFYGTKADKDRVFCFCLMTKMPTFSVHFSFLTSLVLWTIGHVRHLHKYENKIQVNISPGIPIDDLDLEDQIGHHPSIDVPISFQNEIASYFISNISSKPEKLSRASSTFMQGYVTRKLEKMNNKRHNFRYENEDCSIELRFPPVKDIAENSICWASLDTLFSLLSVADILQIISGLLLDRQVLIIGSRLEEVSLSIYALQSMLRPFNFAGTIIPILPTSEGFIDLLQLPTPFLFGVPRCNELKTIKFLETAVFVDLDKKNVPPIEDLPNYPNENYVRSELNKFFNQFKNKQELNEFSLPKIYKKTLHHKYSFSTSSCQKINEIISSPFQNSIYSNYICGFFVSCEGVTVFNQELFLGQVYSLISNEPNELYGESTPLPTREKEKEKKVNEEMEFWNRIVESATFQLYIEDRIVSFTALKYNALQDENKKDEQSSDDKSNNEDDVNKDKSQNRDAKINDEDQNNKNHSSSSEKEEIKDIDKKNKVTISTKKDNLNDHQINKKNIKNRSVSQYGAKSNPIRRYQIKKPQRIKSLKNVLDDLPTPSSSNNKLLEINDDQVKSDTGMDDNQNENLKLSSQKVSKSSIFTIYKSNLIGEEEEENKNEDKKNRSKKKKYNKFDSDSEDDIKNPSKLKPVNKNKSSNEGENKTVRTKPRASTTTSINKKKPFKFNNDDDDENEKNKRHRRSSEKKTSTRPTRKSSNNNNNNDDDDESEDENERNKKHRRSSEKKTSTKSPQKSSNNNDDDDSDDENERNKKHRRSSDKKLVTKPTRKASNNNNDDDDSENERNRKHKKSNESKQSTRKSSNNNDDDDSENENERNRKHRRSSDKKIITKSTRKSSNNSDNDDDDDEDNHKPIRVKPKRVPASAPINDTNKTKSRSQKPTRKTLNNNDDDDDDHEEENSSNKSNDIHQPKRHRKSAPTISKTLQKLKQSSHQKSTRKSSSNNNDDDDDDDDVDVESNTKEDDNENQNTKDKNPVLRKSKQTTKQHRKSSNTNDDEDDENDHEIDHKVRRKSVPTEKKHHHHHHSSRNRNNDDDDDYGDDSHEDENENDQKNKRKSNENNNALKKSKNDRNQKPIVRKNPTQIMKNQLDNRKRSRDHNKDEKTEDGNKKKKIQIQFNSSTEDDTYSSSESFNPGVYYKNEQLDFSSDSYED